MDDTQDTVPTLPIKDRQNRRISLVWLVPVFAVLAALGVAWQNWSQQGPLIDISFEEASGLEVGKTELRFRDIAVGELENLRFADNLDRVIATVRLKKDIAPFVDDEAQFWIVRPEVTTQGVSGLDTVLSGVYMAGNWDDQIGLPQAAFSGLDEPPLIPLGETGVIFTLRSETELPPSDTPILYKGVRIGRLGQSVLDPGGATTSAPAVIFAPHTALVSSASRFWDVSGVDFSVGLQGAELDFDSLASLVAGGVTFETFASGGAPLAEGTEFTLYPDEDAARENFEVLGDGNTVDVITIFDENLPGLQTGAAVTLGGVRLGQVVALTGLVDPDRFGDSAVRLQTTLRLTPGRLGLTISDGPDGLGPFLDARVAAGLRARLTTASILTGGLKVELAVVPDAAPAIISLGPDGLLTIPTAPAQVTNVAGSAQNVLARVNALPIEEVVDQVIGLISDVRQVIGSEEIQSVPASLNATLTAIETLATSDAVADLPQTIAAATGSLQQTSDQLTALLQDIDDEEVVAALSGLLDGLTRTADSLPELSQQAQAVLGQVQALPLQSLTEQTRDTLADVQTLFANEDLAQLPADLRGILAPLTQLAADPALQTLPQRLDQLGETLASVLATVDTVTSEIAAEQLVPTTASTLRALEETAQSLPQISAQISEILQQLDALPLDTLTAEVTNAVTAARDLFGNRDLSELPAELRQSVQTLQAFLADDSLTALPSDFGAVADEARAALGRVDDIVAQVQREDIVGTAANAVSALNTTSQSLPGLTQQAGRVLSQAEDLALQQTLDDLTRLVAALSRVVDQDSTRALPSELNDTLAELRDAVSDIRAGGLIENANATLAAARDAAEAISQASATLPALSARLSEAARQADATLSGFDSDSRFTRDLSAAIAQIDSAAVAIERLAQQIARNPNSLLTGR